MADPAIQVTNLVKRYGDLTAVDGLSFTVRSGEVYGMLGPNGAGKTTTVECVEGLRQPDSGEIQVLGMSHRRESEAIKARMGVQLQSTGLFAKLTVREMLDLYGSFFPRPLPTTEVLALMGLTEKQHLEPATLSGGWRQRVSMALALVNDPELIFLDEPTTGMDPAARRDIWELVKQLKRSGKSLVLTTHYMDEAAQLCDRVAVVDHGRIIAEGRPADLVGQHFSESAIEFATPAQLPLAELKALPGVQRVVTEPAATTLYSTSVPQSVAGLLHLSQGCSFPLERFTVRQPTLEDLFLHLTGRRIRD